MERRVAEKIHKRLDFPEIILMDRYMVKNKAVTRQKREQVKILFILLRNFSAIKPDYFIDKREKIDCSLARPACLALVE
jgi:hypothetical protein